MEWIPLIPDIVLKDWEAYAVRQSQCRRLSEIRGRPSALLQDDCQRLCAKRVAS